MNPLTLETSSQSPSIPEKPVFADIPKGKYRSEGVFRQFQPFRPLNKFIQIAKLFNPW